MVGNDTVARPGGDAAIVRVHGTNKALAITTDCTPRYCYADPVEGGKQAVAETWRNLTAVGATPLAITNCLNFGNPQRPETMGQIVGAIKGMSEACIALDYPVISGNVSLYNETSVGGKSHGIFPTPAIGGVGILKDVNIRAGNRFTKTGEDILLIGDTHGHLGSSIYLRECLTREDGPPPAVDLAQEKKNGDFVRALITTRKVTTCHDVSDGGLLVALAEMTYGGKIGAHLTFPSALPLHAYAFGEDQSRYVLAVDPAYTAALLAGAAKAGVTVTMLGKTQPDLFELESSFSLPVPELTQKHAAWLPSFMAAN